ncbi:hypothetical protein cyc_00513 [Cyclospora cayetanensis]|uniref:Uncharacterized protein n=1 Tax=Cyclospora cayetanensis TaxID=88456 RepID=A0A1D3D8K0_9EIME|nr:hypothetical protein cyc_00513 [Cyclospora cayetanensis]
MEDADMPQLLLRTPAEPGETPASQELGLLLNANRGDEGLQDLVLHTNEPAPTLQRLWTNNSAKQQTDDLQQRHQQGNMHAHLQEQEALHSLLRLFFTQREVATPTMSPLGRASGSTSESRSISKVNARLACSQQPRETGGGQVSSSLLSYHQQSHLQHQRPSRELHYPLEEYGLHETEMFSGNSEGVEYCGRPFLSAAPPSHFLLPTSDQPCMQDTMKHSSERSVAQLPDGLREMQNWALIPPEFLGENPDRCFQHHEQKPPHQQLMPQDPTPQQQALLDGQQHERHQQRPAYQGFQQYEVETQQEEQQHTAICGTEESKKSPPQHGEPLHVPGLATVSLVGGSCGAVARAEPNQNLHQQIQQDLHLDSPLQSQLSALKPSSPQELLFRALISPGVEVHAGRPEGRFSPFSCSLAKTTPLQEDHLQQEAPHQPQQEPHLSVPCRQEHQQQQNESQLAVRNSQMRRMHTLNAP